MYRIDTLIEEKKRINDSINTLKTMIASINLDSNGQSAVKAMNEIIENLNALGKFIDSEIWIDKKVNEKSENSWEMYTGDFIPITSKKN